MRRLLGTTWLEINLDAIKYNIQNIKKLIGNHIKIMCVVKGNGYGHDAIEISRILLEQGVDQLAVARIEEAIILRKNGIVAPILVLGISLEEQIKSYLDYQIMATISNLDYLYKLNSVATKMNKIIKVHLKIETGMYRLGIKSSDIHLLLSQIRKMQNIEIKGVFTHFSTADEKNKNYTLKQFDQFLNAKDIIKNSKIMNNECFHAANSAAILDLPETWLDMVRPGCILYGLYPSEYVRKTINLHPALSFKSCVSAIKDVPEGCFVGYGKTFQTKRDSTLAIIPVGYADGYQRILSNIGQVLIREHKVPVVGRVCMDQMTVDISGIDDVRVGDEVVLWGSQGEESISVNEIAKKLNTITDEIFHLTDKNRVAKLFVKNCKPWKIKNIFGEYYCDGKIQ